MSLDQRQTVTNAAENTLFSPNQRLSSKMDINVTLDSASAATLYPVGYPIGFNNSTGKHAPWTAPDPSVLVVNTGGASGGTWGLTVNSLVIANTVIAYNATALTVKEFLKGYGYDVTVSLASGVYTITFDGDNEVDTIPYALSGDVTQLTGATSPTAVATDGTSTNGTHNIKGFVNPEPTQVGVDTGIITLAGSGTTATATTSSQNALVTGMSVTVAGASDATFNGTFTITVVDSYTFTYTASGSLTATDSGSYTTSNDTMAVIMVEGDIHAALPQGLVDASDVAALNTALKDGLVESSIFVQGLAGIH